MEEGLREAEMSLTSPPPHRTIQMPMSTLQLQVVSLHCNLDENTKHLINKERLSQMKKDSLLINASRGPVIDEEALVDHLQANPDFRYR